MGPAALRAALPRTWGPLIARFGSPNEVQRAAAGPILAGEDVLLVAPTASGKTEAVIAPLAERWCDGEVARVLLVSPTRALANDLARRLREPLAEAGIGLGRWTGDRHDGGRLHEVTVLTPEALDARLARGRRLLRGARALVLDELHVLDGTARGDQVRVLVRRLAHGQDLQVVAAGATVPDPAGLAGRFLRRARIVEVGTRRPIRARIEEAAGADGVAGALARAVGDGFRKVLLFAPSRTEVEALAAALRSRPPFGDAVWAHHGSLARGERLRVEEAFLARPLACCVATSTLEWGVDIGDVDLVALLGAPADVASLAQRAGRGGRRGPTNPLLALARSPFEARVFRAMLEAWARGDLLAAPPAFRPGVLVQQAISLIHELPGGVVTAAALAARLPEDLASAWPEPRLEAVLACAAARGWLEGRGRYHLGPRAEGRWERGLLHGNLAERRGIEVRDVLTGDLLGEVSRLGTGGLGLGGAGREVVVADGVRAVVRRGGTGRGATFGGGPGPLTSPALARRLCEAAGLPVPCRWGSAPVALFHGLGTAGGALLGAALGVAGCPVVRAGPLAAGTAALPRTWPGREAVRRALDRHHARLARGLAMGAFHASLPEAEQRAAVALVADAGAVEAWLETGVPPEAEAAWAEAAAWW